MKKYKEFIKEEAWKEINCIAFAFANHFLSYKSTIERRKNSERNECVDLFTHFLLLLW